MRVLFLVFLSVSVFAQTPKAKFSSDSVRVGNEIQLTMSYLHSSKSDIVFPDSTFDFSPFQFLSSAYFETHTLGGKSLDSVVYTLVTYNLDSVLSIQPFIKNLSTGQRIYADTAKVYLQSMIKEKDLHTASAKETLEVLQVSKDFNVTKLGYYVLGVLFIGLGIVFFFGDWILLKYRLWKFAQYHKRFVVDFKKKSTRPKDVKNIHSALSDWKAYMEWLENQPVSTMSTSEIAELYSDSRLESALKMFDSAIFGGVISDQLPFAYHILLDFSVKRYKAEKKSLSA